MNVKHLIALLALVVPGLAIAQDAGKYQCTLGDLVRRVEILTEPGLTVPCEVHYYKDTEAPGESQVLWSACSVSASPEPEAAPTPEAAPEAEEAEPPVYDDTDVLSPGDPSGS